MGLQDMDITTKKYNLLYLWLKSFGIINQCTGKLVQAVLCSVLLAALVVLVLVLGLGTSMLLSKLQMTLLAQTVGIGTLLIYMLVALLSNLYGVFFLTVIWRIIAAQALQRTQPLSEIFSSSVWPTLYQFIAAIVLSIPCIIVFAILALAARTSSVVLILGLVLTFFIAVRLCYSFVAIAVDNKGPIEGIVTSWQLTAGNNYIDALLMCVMLAGSMLLLEAIFIAVGYGFYVLIPLHFANSFSLAHISPLWWIVGLILGLLGIFYYLAMMAFWVLVFLNRNAQGTAVPTQEETNPIFIPLPELEVPIHDAAAKPSMSVSSASTQPSNPSPSANKQEDLLASHQTPQLEGLEVIQTSVNTTEEDSKEITQHLHQVYTPRSKDSVKTGEEDRMPTILFDDELAKQFQSPDAPLTPPTNGSSELNKEKPIKRSPDEDLE